MEGNLVLLFFLLFFRSTFQQQEHSAPLSSRAERAALLQLRSSLGLRTKDWPIKSDPCLAWIGVLCQDGSVTGINISGFKRTRIGNQNPKFSVDSLANFTKLVSFNASRLTLPGSIPNWLGLQLQTLTVLDLRFCEISGAIPSNIGNLSNLGELYLSDNNLTGTIPSNLGLLSHLSVLDLSRNSLTGLIPSSLGSLAKLSLLDISSNNLSGAIPEDFGNLLNLKSLNLSSNSLSSSVPTHLGNLSSLVVLDLSSSSLSGSVPAEFGSLRHLQRMVICNNNFTGDLPDALWSLPNLSFLDVSSNNFMGLLPNLSLNANTTMAVFNLSHNMFYGVLTSVLKRVSTVDLSYNYFQDKIPDYARNVVSLDRNCFHSWSSQRNVKECAGFYSRKGLSFDNFGLPNGTIHRPLGDHKSNRRMVIFAAVLGTVGLVLLFVILVVLLIICSREERKTTEIGSGLGPSAAGTGAPGASLNLFGEAFGYEEILAATGDFNDGNLVKNGHSGDVFKGVLEGGIHIIVKRFDVHSRKNSCRVELDFFSKVSHPRLVPLLGHCLEKEKEQFLIYKYMPKGDLSSSLYWKIGSDLKLLDWITRLKIAIGVAEGLSYLHHECVPPLVHRDVQASSILLDDKYEVRLGSLTEACIQDTDSHSNKITRLLRLPQISEEVASGVATATCTYDVYSFGKVLLELVTGKIGISASSDSTTKEMLDGLLPFISIYDKELVKIIIDPSLIVDEDLLDEVWAMAVVAKSCLNPKPSRRPLMRFVLKALENPLKVVREETSSSARLGTSSSRNGSWRHNLAAGCGGKGDLKVGEDGCLSARRYSKDVFPEPMGLQDEERWNED
ncbi:probable LRR receptor-like serine/threonine-protein kinase At2g16250 [Cynara cardunculus var. scolymus]|uniref:Concanavalin A-like lectin/glucanase, subgroup n=1 Tax=Cynara cardunculus var. scolymus TaxID=59895 RepID=A0A118JVL4_CYNCS|nr:probable LRR receptor-like serine/threonine-protein kinase At2g16250 [Cynara cardunculus var. scolymus]KVH93247.1 Concanavalin A-like lectin/glucanase, subgroup [Cynara cardunculus var. scolymus]